jgi:high-affinity K+ transport system ATPase subunit B
VESGAEKVERLARQAGCHVQVHREQERRVVGVVKGKRHAEQRLESARWDRDKGMAVMVVMVCGDWELCHERCVNCRLY